ncbi:hypothetical protein PCANC_07769 [Puccinia coronata f. sp. avenae]|uniref:Ubiquitin 3 binding protein But2 C-terminal domain-containing protein n=1 Tax=Puccinia coronata f. sp. avenae TaxID=200324 RepID=A0A2N5VHB4_9BASI|nr:hypothetical protein PCASD_09342 [Puccinia coronata f. sp. avenae]PLW49384.1 hypothetical protein PCANC_07769 [Puccinia coronata f. sp. avenae]
MQFFRFNQVLFGLLLVFQKSIAEDGAPSVTIPGSLSPCAPVPLEIKGGTPPYSVAIKNAGSPHGAVLKNFEDVQKPSTLQWPSGINTGMVLTFQVTDSKGLTTHSDPSTITPTADCSQAPLTFNAPGKSDGGGFAESTDAASGAVIGQNSTEVDAPPGKNKAAGGSTAPSWTDTGTQLLLDVNATSDANVTTVGQPESTNSTNLTSNTVPLPYTPRPSNTTQSKPINNTSSVNNRPNLPKSEAYNGHIGSLYFSLFIASSAGLVISFIS